MFWGWGGGWVEKGGSKCAVAPLVFFVAMPMASIIFFGFAPLLKSLVFISITSTCLHVYMCRFWLTSRRVESFHN